MLDRFQPVINKPNKGEYDGACNRTTCQSEYNVIFYNHSTQKYYCPACAHKINEVNPEAHSMYGHELCTIVSPEENDAKNEAELNALESQTPEC